MKEVKKFEDLKGCTLVAVDNALGDLLQLTLDDGRSFKLYHEQDCCETVTIEEVVGELDDLLNSPLVLAEEVSDEGWDADAGGDHVTWTFYKLATIKGAVTIRWYGTSNGYYSESVDFGPV